MVCLCSNVLFAATNQATIYKPALLTPIGYLDGHWDDILTLLRNIRSQLHDWKRMLQFGMQTSPHVHPLLFNIAN
jgi:hypothetical protein